MKAKKDVYASGKKLPWHFDNEDGFYPKVIKPTLNKINPLWNIEGLFFAREFKDLPDQASVCRDSLDQEDHQYESPSLWVQSLSDTRHPDVLW